MRQRITFIHEPQDAIDPNSFQITKHSLTLNGLKAAREDKITLNLEEVPNQLKDALMKTRELHIKHIQSSTGKTLAPLDARLASGLHVSFSGSPAWSQDSEQVLGEWLTEEFNLKSWDALGPMNSFSFSDKTAESVKKDGQEAQTAYYVPHAQLPSDENFIAPHDRNRWGNLLGQSTTLTKNWSAERLEEMDSATSIDISYALDPKTNQPTLTLAAYWSPRNWDHTTISQLVPSSSTKERIEIGVFSNEPPERPEEVKLAGYLTLLGEDSKPKATMFSFPSKHHAHDAAYGASWIEPTGLHPNLGLQIDNSIPPSSGENCRLYAHLTLPPAVFADRYQFTDSLYLASKNLSSLTWISSPVDLEAPVYAEAAKVSSLLLELAPPRPQNETWATEIPLHLRYLKPSKSGYAKAEIPTPMLFWGCEAEDMDARNPFARQGMVVEKLLPEKNVFYHLRLADRESSYKTVTVPVLSTEYEKYIELGTSLVIMLGFGWVMWKAVQVLVGVGYGSGSEKAVTVEKKKE